MKPENHEPFIPLAATALPDGRRADWRVTVLKSEEQTAAFEPLPPVSPATSAKLPPGRTPRPAATGCEPRVTVEREGEIISAIRVQCSCGQVIELACVYEPPRDQG